MNNNIYNSLKCVWMLSDVVNYKLCDKEFDCENCNLDKAIRNMNIQQFEMPADNLLTENIIQKVIRKISEKEPKGSHILLKNNLIVKNLYGDSYYYGFSPAALHLLDNFVSAELFEKDIIQKNEVFLNLRGDWGSIDISSPINFSWIERIMTMKEQITSERWFGLIDVNKKEIEENMISVLQYQESIDKISTYLQDIEKSFPDIGTTMLDGGNEVHSLHDAIGKENYIKIIKLLFEI